MCACAQVNGGGNHTRSFMYISDLVEGLVMLMNSNYTQPVNLVRREGGREGRRDRKKEGRKEGGKKEGKEGGKKEGKEG